MLEGIRIPTKVFEFELPTVEQPTVLDVILFLTITEIYSP